MKPHLLVSCLLLAACGPFLHAENEYENAPIRYSATTPNDAAQALQKKLLSGSLKLDRTDSWSVLRSLMKQFDIPESSQLLVFSKTSKQNHLINPQTPRAIYFGDNAYLGYCLGGSIEVTTIDPTLGPIFYLLEPDVPADQPLTFERDQSCLSCHGGPFSPDVPGVLVRSVFPGREGHPLMSHGSTLVDTTTPFTDRWGGWYVTGHHGSARHRGNATLEDRDDNATLDTTPGANLPDLTHLFDTKPYPVPQSDIVALMVLEHQSGLLCNERDPPAFAAHLATLLKDPALCETMGRAGLTHAQTHFAQANTSRTLISAFASFGDLRTTPDLRARHPWLRPLLARRLLRKLTTPQLRHRLPKTSSKAFDLDRLMQGS